MPPATYTEAPALRDERISKHLHQAREYWLKAPAYLAADDLCQAGEKAWGAFAQMTKAVASYRGWNHFSHSHVLAAARQVADESQNPAAIRQSITQARSMHVNFYEIDLDRADAELGLAQVGELLQTFWRLLPEQYTGGSSFAEWMAASR